MPSPFAPKDDAPAATTTPSYDEEDGPFTGSQPVRRHRCG